VRVYQDAKILEVLPRESTPLRTGAVALQRGVDHVFQRGDPPVEELDRFLACLLALSKAPQRADCGPHPAERIAHLMCDRGCQPPEICLTLLLGHMGKQALALPRCMRHRVEGQDHTFSLKITTGDFVRRDRFQHTKRGFIEMVSNCRYWALDTTYQEESDDSTSTTEQ